MPASKVTRRRVVAGGLGLLLLRRAAAGEPWPSAKPIRLVVPFTPGSATDIVARLLAESLQPALGCTVIIDNKPGAGGTLGAAIVAKSAADGYTLLVHSAGHLVNPWIYPGLSYDTVKDFAGVTPLASLPNVLVVAPGRFADVHDLVTQARAQPNHFNYASAGNGSATHMNAEVFRLAAGLQAQHVPFRGTPEAMTDVMSGRVDWFFAPITSALPLLQSGKVKGLAVGTAQRSPVLPGLPTTIEAGVPHSDYLFWVGLFAPAATPRAIVEKLQAEVGRIMQSPNMKERLEKLGAEPFTMSPAEFDGFVAAQTAKVARTVKAANIKME